jgi:ArsR family transcriptional regulator
VPSILQRHADQLGALGNPVRLRILKYVVHAGPRGAAAGDIQAKVDIPASTLSHHLKRLAQSGLLQSHGEGTFNYYAADYANLRKLTDYLWENCCGGDGASGPSKP